MQTSHQACLILPGRFVPQFFLEVERRAPVVSRRLETKRAESHLFLTDHQRTARGEVTFMEIRKMRGSGWSPDRLQTGWSGSQSCVWVQASNQTSFSSLFATSKSSMMVWWWTKKVLLLCDFKKRNTNCDCLFLMLLPPAPATPKHLKTWRRF